MTSSGVFSTLVRGAFLSALLGAWVTCIVPLAVAAQHPTSGPLVATVSPSSPTGLMTGRQLGQAESTGLHRIVDVSFSNTPLADAVNEIADQAGIRLVFRRSLLGERRVTLARTKASAADAFAVVLRETGLAVNATTSANGVYTLSPANAARADGVIVGKVVHAKTKRPVVGATVMLDDADQGVVTNEDGEFRLPAAAGDRVIRVRGIGFVRYSQRVNVGDGATVTIEVALEPSANVLNEVIVTGTVVETERKEIPNPITVITADDIEKRGITRIEDLFRGAVPGVVALDSGAEVYDPSVGGIGGMVRSHIYSRGTSTLRTEVQFNVPDPTPLKTYVDGVEMLNSTYLGSIDPQTIERIEIVSGPQAATIYGSGAMGGVMQIFTKKGSRSLAPEITLSLKYGVLQSNVSDGLTPSHNDMVRVTGGNGNDLTYSATLTHVYTGQWQPALFNRTLGGALGVTYTRDKLSATGSFSTTAGRNGLTGGNWSLLGVKRAQEGEYEISGLTYSAPGNRVGTSRNTMIALNTDYRVTSIWQHHITLGKSQNDFTMNAEAPRYRSARSATDTLLTVSTMNGSRTTYGYNTTYQPGPMGWLSWHLTVGANGSSGAQQSITGYRATSRESALVRDGSRAPNVRTTMDDKSWGGFGSWRVGVLDQFYVTLGLRAERNPTYGDAHRIDWTPTNGVTWSQNFGDLTVKLLGSYGRATRAPAPNMKDGWWTNDPDLVIEHIEKQLPNYDLRPERSHGPQGGVELYYGNLGSLTINHYQQRIADLIQNVFVDTLIVPFKTRPDSLRVYIQQYVNVGDIEQQGWEATGSVNLRAFNIRGTYSWNDSRLVKAFGCPNGALCYYPGFSFINVPTHTANLTAAFAHRGTSMTLVTNWIGKTLIYLGDGAESWNWNTSRRLIQYIPRRNIPGSFGARDGYLKSDLVLSHRLTPTTSFTCNITNLGNSFGNDRDYQYPALGRKTLLGVSIRLK